MEYDGPTVEEVSEESPPASPRDTGDLPDGSKEPEEEKEEIPVIPPEELAKVPIFLPPSCLDFYSL